jgi:hypothetical protein
MQHIERDRHGKEERLREVEARVKQCYIHIEGEKKENGVSEAARQLTK